MWNIIQRFYVMQSLWKETKGTLSSLLTNIRKKFRKFMFIFFIPKLSKLLRIGVINPENYQKVFPVENLMLLKRLIVYKVGRPSIILHPSNYNVREIPRKLWQKSDTERYAAWIFEKRFENHWYEVVFCVVAPAHLHSYLHDIFALLEKSKTKAKMELNLFVIL